MATWPNPPLLDSFLRANEIPLTGDGVTTGWAAWTGDPRPDLVSDLVQVATGGGAGVARWTLGTFAASQAASIEIAGLSSSGGQAGEFQVFCCIPNPALGTAYSLDLIVDGIFRPAHFYLRRLVDHGWIHDTLPGPTPATVTVGDAIGLGVNGRTIEAWYRSANVWTLIGTADDATLSGGAAALGAGYAAFRIANPAPTGPNVKIGQWRAGPYDQRLYRLPVLGAG